MFNNIRGPKGFTLVELMIVIGVIGILAAIAIPNFLQFRLKAKSSEAKANHGAIFSTEVAYFAEWNVYVANQDPTPVLDRTNDPSKVVWARDTRFSIIGFYADNQVYFSYELIPNAASGGGINYPTGNQGFTAKASSDLDDDGELAWFTINQLGRETSKGGSEF